MRDEFVLVPRRLTAENGAKAALMGEFHVEQIIGCPDCDEHSGISEDEVCETCGDSGAVVQRLAVPWWTIQEIWLKAIKVVSAPQPVQQPDQLRFSSACEISGPKHPEYVKGYEAAIDRLQARVAELEASTAKIKAEAVREAKKNIVIAGMHRGNLYDQGFIDAIDAYDEQMEKYANHMEADK